MEEVAASLNLLTHHLLVEPKDPTGLIQRDRVVDRDVGVCHRSLDSRSREARSTCYSQLTGSRTKLRLKMRFDFS